MMLIIHASLFCFLQQWLWWLWFCWRRIYEWAIDNNNNNNIDWLAGLTCGHAVHHAIDILLTQFHRNWLIDLLVVWLAALSVIAHCAIDTLLIPFCDFRVVLEAVLPAARVPSTFTPTLPSWRELFQTRRKWGRPVETGSSTKLGQFAW